MSNLAPSMMHRRWKVLRAAVCLAPLALAAGCAAFPTLEAGVSQPTGQRPVTEGSTSAPDPDAASATRELPSVTIPGGRAPAAVRPPATPEQIAALIPDEMVDATLAPQSIPEFAATVFGGVLNVPFTLTSDVTSRTEVIAGGSGGPISKRALFSLTQQSLREYGIQVYIENGFVTVGAASATGGPEINRTRNPVNSAGRVVQFFTVQTIEVAALQALLQDLFPNVGGARITLDERNNSLIISGSGREVAQVIGVLREIDRPAFSGAEVLRVEPSFWAADQLATALEQVLTTEGYVVSRQASSRRALVILAFPTANQILVFGHDPDVMERVRHWVRTMDQPAGLGDKTSTFVYQVRNTDAASVGQLAIGQSPATVEPRAPVGVAGTAPATQGNAGTQQGQQQQSSQGQFMNGRVLTDPVGNRIIFTGTATEFAQLRNLLTTLDTPAPQVVIEVMIAEVTLTDETSLGVQLFGTDVRGDGTASGGTEGIAIGAGGLLLTFNGPDFRARLNAQASNNRLNILQRPQLVARSGGTARFQVGNDVPIITSQRATNTQTGNQNGTDILQSVQYRQTGVILDIQPVVYGDRVDILISQEISEVSRNASAATASPTIINRSLTTQIALTDGWTGVLGGMISNSYSKVNEGVPFLKDIPLVGSAFQNNSVGGTRTELLMLITPHVIRGDEDMASFVDGYSRDLNVAFRTGRGWSYTLTPFSFGEGIRGIGFDLPSPRRASDVAPTNTVTTPTATPTETQAEPEQEPEG